MTDEEQLKLERQQVEWVFGLTGGELADKPIVLKDMEAREWTCHYHYDFYPDYAESELERQFFLFDKMTIVRDCLYGMPPTVLVDEYGRYWTQIACFASSGETSCPDTDSITGDLCPMCEGIHAEGETSYIYLGDGWRELVYVSPEEELS
jgi:hypothetical protein